MCAKFIFKLFVAVSYLLSFVFSVNSFVLRAPRVPISWRKSFRGPFLSHHFSIGSCRRFSLFPAVIVGDYYFVELSQLNIVFFVWISRSIFLVERRGGALTKTYESRRSRQRLRPLRRRQAARQLTPWRRRRSWKRRVHALWGRLRALTIYECHGPGKHDFGINDFG